MLRSEWFLIRPLMRQVPLSLPAIVGSSQAEIPDAKLNQASNESGSSNPYYYPPRLLPGVRRAN